MSDDDTRTETLPPGWERRPSPKEVRERQLTSHDEAVERALARFKAQAQPGRHREEVQLLAHCGDAFFCDDSQHPVDGIKLTWNRSFFEMDPSDNGPYSHLISDTFVDFEFANPEDRKCPKCGNDRHLTDQKRSVAPPLSGYDPRGLLSIARKHMQQGHPDPRTAIAASVAAKPDDEVSELKAQVAELKATIEQAFAQRPVEASLSPSEPEKVKGVRRRAHGWEALLYRTESETGKQKSLGVYDTVEEAAAVRKEALA